MRRALLLAFITLSLRAEAPLTNDDILRMLTDGVPPSVVSAKVKASATRFDLTTDAIVRLTKAGVPEEVLTAMLASTPSGGTPATPQRGPDLLVWKQECEKTGWPASICRPGESGITFHKVLFYAEGARMPSITGELNVTHDHLSAYSLGRHVFTISWADIESFCTQFAWRNLFYLHTKDSEIKFDLGGNEDRLSAYLRKLFLSVRPEDCPK